MAVLIVVDWEGQGGSSSGNDAAIMDRTDMPLCPSA